MSAPWDEVFGDYQATVDWPGGYFWQELMDFYPDAKVLLSVRDPEKWEPSFRETIWNMCLRRVADPPALQRPRPGRPALGSLPEARRAHVLDRAGAVRRRA